MWGSVLGRPYWVLLSYTRGALWIVQREEVVLEEVTVREVTLGKFIQPTSLNE